MVFSIQDSLFIIDIIVKERERKGEKEVGIDNYNKNIHKTNPRP